MLRPLLDNNDQGKTYEETINSRITIAIEKGNKFIASTEKNKPFYGKQVYDNLTDIISIIKVKFLKCQTEIKKIEIIGTKEKWLCNYLQTNQI